MLHYITAVYCFGAFTLNNAQFIVYNIKWIPSRDQVSTTLSYWSNLSSNLFYSIYQGSSVYDVLEASGADEYIYGTLYVVTSNIPPQVETPVLFSQVKKKINWKACVTQVNKERFPPSLLLRSQIAFWKWNHQALSKHVSELSLPWEQWQQTEMNTVTDSSLSQLSFFVFGEPNSTRPFCPQSSFWPRCRAALF